MQSLRSFSIFDQAVRVTIDSPGDPSNQFKGGGGGGGKGAAPKSPLAWQLQSCRQEATGNPMEVMAKHLPEASVLLHMSEVASALPVLGKGHGAGPYDGGKGGWSLSRTAVWWGGGGQPPEQLS